MDGRFNDNVPELMRDEESPRQLQWAQRRARERLTLRLPLESRKSSSPRSTRSMTFRMWETEMLAFSWLVEKLTLEEHSGSLRYDSMFHGPSGSSSEGVESAVNRSSVLASFRLARRRRTF